MELDLGWRYWGVLGRSGGRNGQERKRERRERGKECEGTREGGKWDKRVCLCIWICINHVILIWSESGERGIKAKAGENV